MKKMSWGSTHTAVLFRGKCHVSGVDAIARDDKRLSKDVKAKLALLSVATSQGMNNVLPICVRLHCLVARFGAFGDVKPSQPDSIRKCAIGAVWSMSQ